MSKKDSVRAKGEARYISFKTVDGELIRGKIFVEKGKRISDVFLKGESSFVAVWGVDSLVCAGQSPHCQQEAYRLGGTGRRRARGRCLKGGRFLSLPIAVFVQWICMVAFA